MRHFELFSNILRIFQVSNRRTVDALIEAHIQIKALCLFNKELKSRLNQGIYGVWKVLEMSDMAMFKPYRFSQKKCFWCWNWAPRWSKRILDTLLFWPERRPKKVSLAFSWGERQVALLRRALIISMVH